MHAFLAEHHHRLFPDEMFSDLFPSGRGRPSVPPEQLLKSQLLIAFYSVRSDRLFCEQLEPAGEQPPLPPPPTSHWRVRALKAKRCSMTCASVDASFHARRRIADRYS